MDQSLIEILPFIFRVYQKSDREWLEKAVNCIAKDFCIAAKRNLRIADDSAEGADGEIIKRQGVSKSKLYLLLDESPYNDFQTYNQMGIAFEYFRQGWFLSSKKAKDNV